MGGCCATREKEVKLVEKKDSKEEPDEKPEEQIDSEISYKSDFEDASDEDQKFAAPLEDDT